MVFYASIRATNSKYGPGLLYLHPNRLLCTKVRNIHSRGSTNFHTTTFIRVCVRVCVLSFLFQLSLNRENTSAWESYSATAGGVSTGWSRCVKPPSINILPCIPPTPLPPPPPLPRSYPPPTGQHHHTAHPVRHPNGSVTGGLFGRTDEGGWQRSAWAVSAVVPLSSVHRYN